MFICQKQRGWEWFRVFYVLGSLSKLFIQVVYCINYFSTAMICRGQKQHWEESLFVAYIFRGKAHGGRGGITVRAHGSRRRKLKAHISSAHRKQWEQEPEVSEGSMLAPVASICQWGSTSERFHKWGENVQMHGLMRGISHLNHQKSTYY